MIRWRRLGSAPLRFVVATLALTALVAACAPATMQLDPSLAARAAPLPVTGRQGWQIGQVLSFGGYRTDPVRRSWTLSYDVPFVVRFQGARERLAFRQFDPYGEAAEVYLVHTLRDDELPLAQTHFAIALVDETSLGGTVVTRDAVWDLLVYTTGDPLLGGWSEGFVRSYERAFSLHEVRRLVAPDGTPSLPSDRPVGWEFRAGGRTVGAVEIVGDGRVWLAPELGDGDRLVLASVASALLLRSELRDTMDAI